MKTFLIIVSFLSVFTVPTLLAEEVTVSEPVTSTQMSKKIRTAIAPPPIPLNPGTNRPVRPPKPVEPAEEPIQVEVLTPFSMNLVKGGEGSAAPHNRVFNLWIAENMLKIAQDDALVLSNQITRLTVDVERVKTEVGIAPGVVEAAKLPTVEKELSEAKKKAREVEEYISTQTIIAERSKQELQQSTPRSDREVEMLEAMKRFVAKHRLDKDWLAVPLTADEIAAKVQQVSE
ncbi:MAG: hypothetical protein KBC33_04085 [Candidatus Pacebacteria bacterium]|nr:hypothetical protein [Candidatus Paceibacterota bacterium]